MRLLLALLSLALTLNAQHLNYPLPPLQTGRIYFSEWTNNRVAEYSRDGTHLRDITHPTLQRPRGIATDEYGRLIVVTELNSRILIFELDGSLVQTITHTDLTNGTGINRAPSGEWYVGNFNPGRVLVFAANWTYQRTVTAVGMNGVNCVAFDQNGDYAVSAAFANRLYRFDRSDNPIGSLTHTSIGSPMSVASDSAGNHFLSNGSAAITKFDAAWNPVLVFGAGLVTAPQGIVIDENDELTITSFSSQIVHRFAASGAHLGSFSLRANVVARNLSYQTSAYVLARRGSVNGVAREAVLQVRSHRADQLGRVTMTSTTPLYVDIAASSSGPNGVSFVLVLDGGAPSLAKVWDLPLGTGLFAVPPTWVFAGGTAPSAAIAMPQGSGVTGVIALQVLMLDNGGLAAPALPVSPTNALVIDFR